MRPEIFSPEIQKVFQNVLDASLRNVTKRVSVEGEEKVIPYPFPSPVDWRDCWIYFLMTDRFNNPDAAPKGRWDEIYAFRQGGTFKGVREQLGYIQALGARAIWLTPVLKNSAPGNWAWNYHGYATQDFLAIDGRFASDGRSETAERELMELVEEAHARGIYVIIDIVINHTARVFDYIFNGTVVDSFADGGILDGPLGCEPPVKWLNGEGKPEWQQDLPAPDQLSGDDAIWPSDLQRRDFFRRRGTKLSDKAGPGSFAHGDFGSMRQLVAEYLANSPDQKQLREKYGKTPVLSILIQVYQYLIAKFDIDGFRIDTVKYVDPTMVETFGNAIREFASSIGKNNFFTFGEVYDDESTIAGFVGRNSSDGDGYGIDAALDFPLFFNLPAIAKARLGVEHIRRVFLDRKKAEKELLSSHGEAGRFFVSFLDNHDQNERFNHPQAIQLQITLGLGALFCLQGIPCLYYGTEQGLFGTLDEHGHPALGTLESVREALWGKDQAFDRSHPLFQTIRALSELRRTEPALRYGRLYFREVSGNGIDFGHSKGEGGVLAFSRILNNREVLIVANTSTTRSFSGHVLVDPDLNRSLGQKLVAFSNKGTTGASRVQIVEQARYYDDNDRICGWGEAASLAVELAPMELQILTPELRMEPTAFLVKRLGIKITSTEMP